MNTLQHTAQDEELAQELTEEQIQRIQAAVRGLDEILQELLVENIGKKSAET